jgi:hypothetical protein
MGGQPVDQAGEDIVYVVPGDGTLTMVVRIVYQGESSNFAWILPLPTVPDAIELGPDAMFAQLATATGPQFTLTQRTEGTCRQLDCDFSSGGGCGPGCGFAAADGPPAWDASSSFRGDDGGVTVIDQQVVGAYETVVLSGGTADELYGWLVSHGYDLPEASRPLIADYVAARHVFLALRLRARSTNDAIQPISVRLPTEQPCLPIRLTAIATVPGLPIRAYFLGQAPWVPTNYTLLDPPYTSGLFLGTVQWPQRWSQAIDEAGGHAWVRDYAGTPPAMNLSLPRLEGLSDASPGTFFQTVSSLGYPREALIAVAPDYVEPPDGYELVEYIDECIRGPYSCPAARRFDPAGLAMALEVQVRLPRQRLQRAFDTQPWLTRLYTTMDAEEMTLDPEFRADPGVGPQSNMHNAVLVTECGPDVFPEGAGQRMEFPNGRSERVREADPSLPADVACRMRGARGARSRGCAASLGRHAALRPALIALAALAALIVRRARRHRRG